MIPTVDLHTHILPGLDDGAENFKESMQMLKIAVRNGTTDLVLTPHYLAKDMRSKKCRKEDIVEVFEAFKAAVAERLPEINLYLGAEMFAVSNIEDVIEDGQMITINNTNYCLLEFSFNDYLSRAVDVTKALTQAGYIPIIAHPERYSFIQHNPRSIIELLEKGAVLQLNTSSLAGHNGSLAQDVAISFLENHLAAVIASDSHSTYQRDPDLSEAYAFVSSSFSYGYAEDLFYTNPLAIVKGRRI